MKNIDTKTAPSFKRSFDIDCLLDYEVQERTDFLFQIHAHDGIGQHVVEESLQLSRNAEVRIHRALNSHHRVARVTAMPGSFTVRYQALVSVETVVHNEASNEIPVSELPDEILPFLLPTRYCESDLLARASWGLFGDVTPGSARIQAIADWIHTHVQYVAGTTQSTTTAADVFVSRAGVCRDFAHLGIAFCRALNIPARFVAGYAIFDTPDTDFHAVFEVYLDDGWVSVDATRMTRLHNMVRIASGRDAKDVAFATLFGPSSMTRMSPAIRARVGSDTTHSDTDMAASGVTAPSRARPNVSGAATRSPSM